MGRLRNLAIPTVCAVTALLLVAPRWSHAAEPKQRAIELGAEAAEAARAGEHDRAVVLLDAAYALDPDPVYLFNRGVVQELAGDREGAIRSFARFVDEEPDPSRREQGEARLRALREAADDPEPPGREAPEAAFWDIGLWGMFGGDALAHGDFDLAAGLGVSFQREVLPWLDVGAWLELAVHPPDLSALGLLVDLDVVVRFKWALLDGAIELYIGIPVGFTWYQMDDARSAKYRQHYLHSEGTGSEDVPFHGMFGLNLGVFGGVAYRPLPAFGLFLEAGGSVHWVSREGDDLTQGMGQVRLGVFFPF